jgi:hypothetical protein
MHVLFCSDAAKIIFLGQLLHNKTIILCALSKQFQKKQTNCKAAVNFINFAAV